MPVLVNKAPRPAESPTPHMSIVYTPLTVGVKVGEAIKVSCSVTAKEIGLETCEEGPEGPETSAYIVTA